MNTQSCQLLADRTQPTGLIKDPELLQMAAAFLQRGLGRCIEPGKALPQPRSPQSQFHDQRLRIRQLQFRLAEGWSPLLFRRRPQPDAVPGALAAGSAAALIGAGKAGWHRFQAFHAGVGVVAELATEAAVDHKTHPVNRDGAFGNRAGQHHFPVAAGRAGLQRFALAGQRNLAVEWLDLPVVERRGLLQDVPAAFDLGNPGQEHQNAAAFGQRQGMGLNGTEHLQRQGLVHPGWLVGRRDGMGATLAFENRRLRQTPTQVRQVERRRHQHQAQIRP